MRLLLEYGANVSIATGDLETAFLRTAERRHPQVLRILLEHGAKVNILNTRGQSALHAACRGFIIMTSTEITVRKHYGRQARALI